MSQRKKMVFLCFLLSLFSGLVLSSCEKGVASLKKTASKENTEHNKLVEGTNLGVADKLVNNANESGIGDAAKPANSEATPKPDPLQFTRYLDYDMKSPKVSTETSPVRKWLAENKGVTVQEISTDGDAASKLQSMITSGQLPDVITLARGAELDQLIAEGHLVALDDFIEKYPNVRNQISEATLNMLRSEDGKIYMLPNWFISSKSRGNGVNGYVINKKIYKALGSPPLDTFVDLNNYLSLVKASYTDIIPLLMGPPRNGNVQAQNIFYSGFAEGRIPEMMQIDGMAAYPVRSQLESILSDQAFIESMMYTSQLFRNGLLSPDAFSRTEEQNEQSLNQGKAAVYVGYNVIQTISKANKILSDQDPEAGYEMIWPFRKEGLKRNKIYPNSYQTLGWNAVVITTHASEPERIFEFLDWSISAEATRIYNYGPPGLMWDEMDSGGTPIPNKAYKQMKEDQLAKLELGHFIPFGSSSERSAQSQARELMLPSLERDWGVMANYNVASRTSMDRTEFIELSPPPESEEGVVAAKIKLILSQAFLNMVAADSDEKVLSLIDQAIVDTEAAAYSKLLEWKTNKWQENVKKMDGD